MGKAEKGTPKDLANRMKAKGLQKLRWYCQMCQKQCRDENGFKCHTMSESHQRQLLLFAEDPDKYLDSFSEDFYKDYLNLLKRRFGTKRVPANNVYQEYIQDRSHIHMNATQWETLTEFVKWLGREGHCIVDETEKGWYVAYIDRDPETILRQEKLARKEKNEMDAEGRRQAFIDKQIEIGLQKAKPQPEVIYADLKRDDENPIKLNLAISVATKAVPTSSGLAALSSKLKIKTESIPGKAKELSKKRSALEEIMEEEKRKKTPKYQEESKANDEAWLAENIIVKVVTKSLGEKFHKKKGVIYGLVNDHVAKVKMLECNTKLKLDQAHLETVVPSIGRQVLVLGGPHKGHTATLDSLQLDTFSATLYLQRGDTLVKGMLYEHFSKLHVPEKGKIV